MEVRSLPLTQAEQSCAGPKTLYVFMDESGDMTFRGKSGTKGTQYFLLSAVMMDDPLPSAAAMQELKYSLMADGSPDLEFHATENSTGTRKRVLETLGGMSQLRVHTLWIDKGFTHPTYQDPVKLFSLFGKAMGTWICKTMGSEYDNVILLFDSVLTAKQQKAFSAEVKPRLKGLGVEYKLLFHPVKSDLNGQIADYFSWSKFRQLERDDLGPCGSLSMHNWTDFNLFASGHTRYWEKMTTPPT